MQKTSLITLLKSLSPEEIKEFGYFVQSPFFNRNNGLIRLYDYLKKVYPEFKEKEIKKEHVYMAIFDKAEYNDGFMRVLISNLSKLLKDYLTFINYKKRPSRSKLSLLNELNLRKLAKEFKTVQKETEKTLKELPDTDMWYYHDKALLEDNNYYYNTWAGKQKSSKSNKEKMLKNIMDNFTRFYLISSLTMYRLVLHINNYNKLNVDLKFTEEVIKLLEKTQDDFADTPIINIYLYEIMLLSKGELKYFEKLKTMFIQSSDRFTYSENYSLLNILQKFSNVQILKGKFRFEKEKFHLFKNAVKKNILKYPFADHIEGNLFFSIVNAALKVKEINWAGDFIIEQKKFLSNGNKDTFLNLSLGIYYFERNELDKSKQAIQSIKTNNYDTLFILKILQMKIFFMEDNYIQAELVMDSFRHLLNKSDKDYSPIIQDSYKNFLKTYSWLIKAKEKDKTDLALKVLVELRKNKTVQEYQWLKLNAESIK